MIYFASDLHIGHTRILNWLRPKNWTLDYMWNLCKASWNAVVTAQDQVYLLGDCFWNEKDCVLLSELNGQKILCPGNHDRITGKIKKYATVLKPIYTLKIDDPDVATTTFTDDSQSDSDEQVDKSKGKRQIVLCHYPIEDWKGIDDGSWHLHGHTHSAGKFKQIVPNYPRLDVCWETLANRFGSWKKVVISYDEVKALLGNHRFNRKSPDCPIYSGANEVMPDPDAPVS